MAVIATKHTSFGASLCRYAWDCARGAYDLARGVSVDLATRVKEQFNHSIKREKREQLKDKTTIVEVDFSKRKWGVFPKIKRAHVISDPELIDACLRKQRDGELFSNGSHSSLDPLLGPDNMLLSVHHARLRKPLERLFSIHTIRHEYTREIYQAALTHLSEYRKGKNIDSAVRGYILSILFDTILGLPNDLEQRNRIAELIFTKDRPAEDIRAALRVEIRHLLEENAGKPNRALAVLAEAPELSEEEKISTVLLLMFAGTFSTIGTLSGLIKLIGSQQFILDYVNAEYQPPPAATAEYFEEFATKKEGMLDACYWEFIRYSPFFSDVSRIAKTGMQIGDLSIEAGDEVHFNLIKSQRDPQIWGENPDQFIPDRFIDHPELIAKLRTFGYGRESCIGKQLVAWEIKIFAALFAILCPEKFPNVKATVQEVNQIGDPRNPIITSTVIQLDE